MEELTFLKPKDKLSESRVMISLLQSFEREIESLIETLDILSNKEEIDSINRGIRDILKGNILSFDELAKKHNLLKDEI